ncbi:MAG: transcriptional regulator [Candidatus Thermoplasmatota archaeon]|jgi:DNA-binding PadR family transcriptional regulator|nr:transcriptional regulator [Candidatus Thermoplasmatota archaeon]MCL5791187.1 transcriptional regulator [Candidatus Thermoplasmatota archaeon]
MSEELDFSEIVGDDLYSSGVRTGIMIALYGIRKITFTDLLISTGLPRSSFYSHLKYLSENQYITVRTEITLRRPLTFIRITDTGMRKVENYFRIIEKYRQKNNE